MNVSAIRQILARHASPPGRPVIASLLLSAVMLALFAGSALATSGNLVRNSSFERDTDGDGLPNSWTMVGRTSADKRVCNKSYIGMCSFKMMASGGTSTDKWIEQSPAILPGSDGDVYTLTLWVKAKDLVLTSGASWIELDVHQLDGGFDYLQVPIAAGTYGWTLYTVEVITTEDHDTVRIIIDCEAESGKIWIDKVKLIGP